MTRKWLPSSDNKLTRTSPQGSLEGRLVSISLQPEGWPGRRRKTLAAQAASEAPKQGQEGAGKSGLEHLLLVVSSHLWSQIPQALGSSRTSPGTKTSLRS